MLKALPPLITPELLFTLAAMGHGDRIAIVDRNYPALARHGRVHSLAGVDTTVAAAAILQLLPVDDFVAPAAFRMVPDSDSGAEFSGAEFEAHRMMAQALQEAEGRAVALDPVERTAFYDLAQSAYAVVQTSDARPYSCFVITKGVVDDTSFRAS